MQVSVVVPVFNSAATLEELGRRLIRSLREIEPAFEIILVNDGSRDESWEKIKALAAAHPEISGIDLMRNYGQHNALLQGIKAARGNVIVTVDDDLQNPPEEIARLLAAIAAGADVVYGVPGKTRHALWRRASSNLIRLLLRSALGRAPAQNVSSFRAFRASLKESFRYYHGPSVVIDVPLSWGTDRFAAVEVRHDQRREGRSNYNFSHLLGHAFSVVTGFSVLPLKIVSLLGFGFTGLGILILAYVVGRYLALGYSLPGFPFLASIVSIFSGAQLLVLGVMGSYLARLHFRTMGKPAGLVRTIVGRENRDPDPDQEGEPVRPDS